MADLERTHIQSHNRSRRRPSPGYRPPPDLSNNRISVESKGQVESPVFDKKPKIEKLPDNLTITSYYDQIVRLVDENDISLLVCATGTGKTTGVPPMLLKAHPDARIVVTQPRNAPMEEIASYTAELAGTHVGELVGVRYKGSRKKWGDKTQIMFEMEQTLWNELTEDPLLMKYNIVHLDEVHENNELTHRLFMKLCKVQEMRKEKGLEPLKIILTTATVDKDDMSKKMKNAKAYEIENSKPPKDIKVIDHNKPAKIEEIPQEAAIEVKDILDKIKKGEKEKGDILVFLPGKSEIDKFFRELEKLEITKDEYTFLKLHSKSTQDDKDEIKNRKPDGPYRIIASTNSGETGYSFPSPLKYEVDSGWVKQIVIDPDTGIEYIDTIRHSWSGLVQRLGRLGRKEDGEAHPLYTPQEFEEQKKNYKYTTPEIRRMSLFKPVLELLHSGEKAEVLLEYPEPPEEKELKRTLRSLTLLGALNDDGILTEVGHEMADMDMDDPHLARMIIESKRIGGKDIACTITAMIENSEGLIQGKFQERQAIMKSFQKDTGKSDYQTFVNMYREILSHQNDPKWMEEKKIDQRIFETIVERQKELLGGEKDTSHDPDIVGKLALVAYADRLMQKNPDNTYHFLASNHETHMHIYYNSAASGSRADFVIMGSLRKIDGTLSAENIQPINPEWVKELTPWLLSEKELPAPPYFDKNKGSVVATKDTYLGTKVVDQEPIPVKEEVASDIFVSALSRGDVQGNPIIDKNNEAIQKIKFEVPEEKIKKWYQERLSKITSAEQLQEELEKNPDLAKALQIRIEDFIPPNLETHSARTQTSTLSKPVESKPTYVSFPQKIKQSVQQTWNKFVTFLKNLFR